MLSYENLLVYSVLCVVLDMPLVLMSSFLSGSLLLGELRPFNPTVEEGDDLEMKCSIYQNYSPTYNIRDVVFEVGNVEFKVTDANVHVISDDVISLSLYNLRANMTHTMVVCLMRDEFGEDVIGYQTIQVTKRPLQPEVECVVLKWLVMDCVWSPTEEEERRYTERHDTNLTFFWRQHNTSDSDLHTCSNVIGENTCRWMVNTVNNKHQQLPLDVEYSVKVTVESVHTTLTTDWVHFSPLDIVKPDPVTVQFIPINTTSERVVWVSPNNQYDLQYRLSYRSQWDTPSLWQNITLLDNNVSLHDLLPHTTYDVRLWVKPIRAGFWSDVTSTTFTTSPAVPRMNPLVTIGGFQILERCGFECRRIVIFWKPLSEQDHQAPMLQYEIQHRQLDDNDWVSHTVSEHTSQYVIECTDRTEEIQVLAKNEMGYSTSTHTSIVIPEKQQTLQAATLQVLLLNDSVATMSWEFADESEPDNLTAVWCQGRMRQQLCQSALLWEVISANESTYTVSLPEDSTSSGWTYMFGLSVNSRDVSSGIHWATCLYHRDAEPSPPERLQFSAHQQHNCLTVLWSVMTCEDSKAFILAYTVYSCVTQDAASCSGSTTTDRVAATEDQFIVTDLKGGQTYLVWMDSVSYTGHSDPTKTIHQQTTQTWARGGVVAAIVVFVILADVLVIIGCIAVMLKVRRCRRLLRLEITVPNKVLHCTDL